MGDWQQEFDEGRKELGPVAMAVYKFFAMFRVGKSAEIFFGVRIIDETELGEISNQIRDYVKEQKAWVRTQGRSLSPREANRRMWWLITKVIELGIFTSSEQRTVMCYYDMTLDLLRAHSTTPSGYPPSDTHHSE